MSVTRGQFAGQLLKGLNAPHSRLSKSGRRNRRALVAWQQAEGSRARFNPLATTQPMPGATDFNDIGVKNYVSLEQGVGATVKTLGFSGHRYELIVGRLRRAKPAEMTLEAVAASDWGTGELALKVLAGWRHHWDRYRAASRTPIST